MRAAVALLTVAVLGLAGCSGGSADGSDTDGPADPTGATADDKGAVAGLVVDAEGLPVAEAQVAISYPTAAEPFDVAAADATGRFAFDLLDPDSYRLTATGPSYRSTSVVLEVVAGQSVGLTLVLDKAVTREPFHFTLIQTGQLSCAAAVVVLPTAGACPQDANEHTVFFEIPDGFALLVGEATWDSGDEELAQYFLEDNRTTAAENGTAANATLGEAWGPPGLRVDLLPGKQNTPAQQGVVAGVPYGPVPARAFTLNVSSFYAGLMAGDIDEAGNAACSSVYGRCAGFGATLSLRFDTYVTVFMYRTPSAPAAFSALPDA